MSRVYRLTYENGIEQYYNAMTANHVKEIADMNMNSEIDITLVPNDLLDDMYFNDNGEPKSFSEFLSENETFGCICTNNV